MKVKNSEVGDMEFEEFNFKIKGFNIKVNMPDRYFLGTSGYTEVYSKSAKNKMARCWASSVLGWNVGLKGNDKRDILKLGIPTVNCENIQVVSIERMG